MLTFNLLLHEAPSDEDEHGADAVTRVARSERLLGASQITDSYLLALAVTKRGCFVTFDERVDPTTVGRATPDNLVVL